MSKLKTNTIQHTGGSADNITLDNSQNVTIEGNATVDGTSTLTGNVTASGNLIANGKVGIGNDASYASGDADDLIIGTTSGSSNHGLTILSPTNKNAGIYFSDGDNPNGAHRGYFDYNHTTDALNIGTAGAQKVVINSAGSISVPSGQGIDFSATSNSSEATGSGFSEVLDDYEEGECTMGFKFSGGDFNGSYAERAGKYTKIGNQVHVDFHMNLSNRGSNTSGYVVIRGLPFTVINNTHFRGSGTVGYFSNADSGVGSIFLFLTHNSTEFEPRIPGSGTVTSIASGDITNSFNMYGSVTYFTS